MTDLPARETAEVVKPSVPAWVIVEATVEGAAPAAARILLDVVRDDPTYIYTAPHTLPGLGAWFVSKPLERVWLALEDRTRRPLGMVAVASRGPAAKRPGLTATVEMCRLAVITKARRSGISAALCETAVEAATRSGIHERMWLRCIIDSPAHRMYLRQGWLEWSEATPDATVAAIERLVILHRPLVTGRLPADGISA